MTNVTIPLERAKRHLHVMHDLEDAYIAELIPVALAMVANDIDRPLTDPKCLTPDGQLADPLISAALLILGDLYQNRETQQNEQLYKNHTFDRLIASYCRMGL